MSNEKHFPEGLYYKKPHPNAPDFVKGQINIKVEEFKKYLNRVQGDWLNLDLKVSKEGKPYAEVNTFKPDKAKAKPKKQETHPQWDEPESDDDLPF